jgi:hypothetical protein
VFVNYNVMKMFFHLNPKKLSFLFSHIFLTHHHAMSNNTPSTPPRQQRDDEEAPGAPMMSRTVSSLREGLTGPRRLDFDDAKNFGVKSKRVYAFKQ